MTSFLSDTITFFYRGQHYKVYSLDYLGFSHGTILDLKHNPGSKNEVFALPEVPDI